MRIPVWIFLSLAAFTLFIPIVTLAAPQDLFFDVGNTRFDPAKPVVGEPIKVYLRIRNTTSEDMKGVVRGFDITEGKKIEIEQSFTTIAKGKADVFLNFTPQKYGVHELNFRIITWENYESNDLKTDKIIQKIYIDSDNDGDGIGDAQDSDDDNDGVLDVDDLFPTDAKESKDSDNDGVGDNADTDDDNDGIEDDKDAFPYDRAEGNDLDGDGKGDNEDEDDDGDGISDEIERQNGTDPLSADTDDDGVNDGEDDFPLDQKFQYDTDKDGIANSDDTDDDGDGYADGKDAFPLDKNEWADSDGDGIGDFADLDDDNDGLEDREEIEKGADPRNSDTDGDGVQDGKDSFPLDPKETEDSDNDGLGDNTDPNNNNKGPVIVFPEDQVFESGRGELFSLDASKSYDPENPEAKKLTFIWQVLDNNGKVLQSREGAVFQAIFPFMGSQDIRLTVRDEADEPRVHDFTITVFLAKRDIILGFVIFILLNILGFFIYRLFKKKQLAE